MRVAILAHERFPDRAKTAVGVLRYADHEVVAVLDRELAETGDRRVGEFVPGVQDAPIVGRVDEAPAFDALLIGVAPIGGGFDSSWRLDVRRAIERGADVVSGLHYLLHEDEEFARLAAEHGTELRDVRDPPDDLTVASGTAAEVDATVVLTVGSDCSTGKMTTACELVEAAERAGLDAAFVPTGQTGIMVEGWGIAVDRTVSDFTAGAVERLVRERGDRDYLFVEGQGSIIHPAYSAVTCGLLHGAMPDALVFTHRAGRERVHGYEAFEIGDLRAVADCYERLARPVHPAEVVAGALDTHGRTDPAADLAAYREALGVPVADPVVDGADDLLAAVREATG